MILSSFRIVKFSFQDIFRNIWLSIVTVTILILALFSINMLLVVQVVGQGAVDAIKDKVDISLYLKPSAGEEDINNLADQIRAMDGVKEVDYISRDNALEFFRDKYQDKPEVLDALKELGQNPLNPSLVIKPDNGDNIRSLTTKLNTIESDIIDSRDFTDHKIMLDKINSITDKVSKVGLIISLIFILTTILVVYNSIRVAIYTHRKEITIMRLVGASNSFVYMPFILSGLIYAVLGVLVVACLFYPFLTLLQPYMEVFFIDLNIDVIGYFKDNFIQIVALQLLGVSVINMLASMVAVRKYANV